MFIDKFMEYIDSYLTVSYGSTVDDYQMNEAFSCP